MTTELSRYTCLGCGDPLPRGRGGHCDACVEWNDPADGPPAIDESDGPADPDPAPGRRVLVPTVHTTAREWLDEDRRQDAIARAWSARLLVKRGAA